MKKERDNNCEHFWQGQWIGDLELDKRLSSLADWAAPGSLDLDVLLDATSEFSKRLKNKSGNYSALFTCLLEESDADTAQSTLSEMARFIERENLEQKLKRELGSTRPFLPTRAQYEDSVFEAWAPLGLLTHVAPSNAVTVAPLSVIEGLLSGNFNFLKTSSSDGVFPQLFLEGLLECDPLQRLNLFVIAARIPSQRRDQLERIFSASDGISAWGGESALESIRKLAPSRARMVEWGHKISFTYFSKQSLNDPSVFNKALKSAAEECCLFEQQSCSSPQCIYVESESDSELEAFASRLAQTLEEASSSERFQPSVEPSSSEQAEITLVTELAKQEACVGLGKVIEGAKRDWRILVDSRSPLTASPLFRTIWVKPLPRSRIVSTLRPMSAYLQTVGLACGLSEVAELSNAFVRAGAFRVRRIGEMTGSYNGEPHDGVYALQRYCKRISIQLGSDAAGISSFADLRKDEAPVWEKKPPIRGKADFQEAKVDSRYAHLFFKSGGSTGEPKLSIFSYDDYQEQMRIGAEGLSPPVSIR